MSEEMSITPVRLEESAALCLCKKQAIRVRSGPHGMAALKAARGQIIRVEVEFLKAAEASNPVEYELLSVLTEEKIKKRRRSKKKRGYRLFFPETMSPPLHKPVRFGSDILVFCRKGGLVPITRDLVASEGEYLSEYLGEEGAFFLFYNANMAEILQLELAEFEQKYVVDYAVQM